MANHAPAHEPRGFADHADTYKGFLTGSIALSMVCGYILVALVAFAFMDSYNVVTGFVTIILGTLATLVAMRTGGKWIVPGALLVLLGLLVAINL